MMATDWWIARTSDLALLAGFEHGMELLLSGNASKVLMYPNGLP